VTLSEAPPKEFSFFRTEKLSQFLRVGDAGFPGGTVGELVRHILDNRLSVPYGSRPQLVLANLTHDMVRQVDGRMEVLEDSIERYKAQNPAHNAALKELLIAATHYRCNGHAWCGGGGYHVGGCGTHCGHAYHDGARPSLFNFPQGEQPAGLQSQAYARSTLPYNLPNRLAPSRTAEELSWLLKPAADSAAMTETEAGAKNASRDAAPQQAARH
jgi:hypothetical protein